MPIRVTPAVLASPSPAGPAALTGKASISGPVAPVTGPFAVVVTGRAIAQVTFSVDGRRRGTVRATRRGQKRFKLVINPRGQSLRVHRVTARIT